MTDIDIIIVHYHAAALVRDAVHSLQNDARSSGLAIQTFVADNGSTPEERALLQSLPIHYVPSGGDLGYAGGANTAFAATRANFIVLMNEDIVVLPGCLAALKHVLERGAAVSGPEFFWDLDRAFLLPCTEERTRRNELVKASGNRDLARLQRARECWRLHARRHWRAESPIDSTSISGALLMFRRDTWERVGAWDSGYQMYFDENDWLLRAERAGLRSVYVPAAKAVHLHNPKLMGDPDRAQWQSESFLRFGNRYYGDTFMRRLFRIGGRQPVIPDWKPLASPNGADLELELPAVSALPLWIELTPSPFGFPAAATRIIRPSNRWRLPPMRGLPFLTGTFFLTVVDDDGRELGQYRFDRRTTHEQRSSAEQEQVSA